VLALLKGSLAKLDRSTPSGLCPVASESPSGASSSRIRVSTHHPIDKELSLGAPYTQTPGATPRKVFRIPEMGSRVNEKGVENQGKRI
jgi:hypothetical protein